MLRTATFIAGLGFLVLGSPLGSAAATPDTPPDARMPALLALDGFDPFRPYPEDQRWRELARMAPGAPRTARALAAREHLPEPDGPRCIRSAAARWLVARDLAAPAAHELQRDAARLAPELHGLVPPVAHDIASCLAHPACVPAAPEHLRALAAGTLSLQDVPAAHRARLAEQLLDGLPRARRPEAALALLEQLVAPTAHDVGPDQEALLLSVALRTAVASSRENGAALQRILPHLSRHARLHLAAVLEGEGASALAAGDTAAAAVLLDRQAVAGTQAPSPWSPWLAAGVARRGRTLDARVAWARAIGCLDAGATLPVRTEILLLRRADRDAVALERVRHLRQRASVSPVALIEALDACVPLALRQSHAAEADLCLTRLETTVRQERIPGVMVATAIEALRVDVALGHWIDGDPHAALVRLRPTQDAERGSGFHRARAAWWQARIADAVGRSQEAAQACLAAHEAAPLSLYGRLAVACLPPGGDMLQRLRVRSPVFSAEAPGAGALLLLGMGLHEDAVRHATHLVFDLGVDAPAAQAVLALELARRGDATALARLEHVHVRLGQRDAPTLAAWAGPTLVALHPTPWRDTVAAASERWGIQPSFVLAVARRESAFRPGAISPVGARGLLQVQPATVALALGALAGERPPTRAGLLDPERNLYAGSAVLRWLAERWHGCPYRVAASYSTGHGRVARWLREDAVAARDPVLWMERIPYPTVRHYVRDMVVTAERYAVLDGPEDVRARVPARCAVWTGACAPDEGAGSGVADASSAESHR